MEGQTIVAIATPPGTGGIAVVRMSGGDSYDIASKVFEPKNKRKNIGKMAGYTAVYGHFHNNGAVFDDGIALCFRAPGSYTGEDAVEFSCHGGEVVSRMLVEACLQNGAKPAGPGEFTQRALINGKISLNQAEAVLELLSAETRDGVYAAQVAMSGRLQREIDEIKNDLLELAAHLAAWVDYPEEDVEALETERFLEIVKLNRNKLKIMIDGYDRGSVVRRGVSAAIIGSPNVGKSTIFNLLSGFERAIVTPVAGTTRDVITEKINIGGIILHLSDTAGLHETEDLVEREGIRRSYGILEGAGLILAVFDGSMPISDADRVLARSCEGKIALGIVNKADLTDANDYSELSDYFKMFLSVSARAEETRGVIEGAIRKTLRVEVVNTDEMLLTNQRQLSSALAAFGSLTDAESVLASGLTLDVAGVMVEDSIKSLSELAGEDVADSIIDELFSKYCVGK